jgi:integrase
MREQHKEKEEAMTIDRLWEKFKEEKSLKSINTDESRLKLYISPHMGMKEPKNLIPLDVDRLTRKALKGKSPQTVKLTLSLLRRIVNFGVKKQLCGSMTFKIEMPVVNNIVIEDLNHQQMAKLMKAISDDPYPEVAAVLSMALFTGMRRGELLSLQWDNIDFDRGFISIKNPKGGQNETIPLSESARQVLITLPRGVSPYVFPGRGGQKRPDIRRAANRIRKAADLPKEFRPLHGLRHVFASMLASSGQVDLFTLQKLLTHKDPKTTQRYAHLRDDALRKASNLAGDIIEQAAKAS